MEIDKKIAASKLLKSKSSASFHIHADYHLNDKKSAQKDISKTIERSVRRNRDLTVIIIEH